MRLPLVCDQRIAIAWRSSRRLVVLTVGAVAYPSRRCGCLGRRRPRRTALLDAAERGDRAAALRLLRKGADPNTPGPDGTTAIMYAAANDDVELVRALIKAGANVKLKNQFGTSAHHRGRHHRLGADHRRAAQGRRRSQHARTRKGRRR